MSSKINILVVDDEIEMRIALQKSLEKCGYRVELAHNVETALNKFYPKQFYCIQILNYIQKEKEICPLLY